MPRASRVPGLKKAMAADGTHVWRWVASQVSRLATDFRPRSVRLWSGLDSPSAAEMEVIQQMAEQLWIDVQEWVHDRHRTVRSRRGMIYFLRVGSKVKIGFTNDVERRMSELQSASPFPLALVLVLRGSAVTERALHRRFRTARLSREWFEYDGAIAAFVAREQQRAERQNRPSESPSESQVRKRGESIC